ncbi:MAG TPA: sensor histidine kinase [Polyangia bacterium]|jgi:signal transduction histidine kinase
MAAQPHLVGRFRSAARVAGVITSVTGALVFLGWAVNNPAIDAFLAGRFIMQLNTGVAFMLAGAALWMRPRLFATLSAVAVLGCGLFMVAEHVRAGAAVPGRMEPDTAFGFVLIGTALVLRQLRTPASRRIAEWLIIACLLVAMVGLFGFTYNVKFFYGITQHVKMTLGTAIAFVVVGLGALFADPEHGVMAGVVSDTAGGVMARRLYPAAIAIPIVIGQLTLVGERMRLYNGKFGLSLFLLTSIVVFVLLVSLTYAALDRADAARIRLAAVLLEESERRHIATELHDEIGQSLTALKLRLHVADPSEHVVQSREIVDDLMRRVSSLSLDLRPPMLDDFGLLPALRWLIDRYKVQTGVEVEFAHAGLEGRVAPAVETAAFRIAQEALTNVARHAEVKRVNVRARCHDGLLTLQIADEGKGFEASAALAAANSTGLSGMRERAAALGGSLTIETASGAGTCLTAELPLDLHHIAKVARG